MADETGEKVRAGISESEMRANAVRAITGSRWEDGAPFDAAGPGTSDLDLTFVGGEVLLAEIEVPAS